MGLMETVLFNASQYHKHKVAEEADDVQVCWLLYAMRGSTQDIFASFTRFLLLRLLHFASLQPTSLAGPQAHA